MQMYYLTVSKGQSLGGLGWVLSLGSHNTKFEVLVWLHSLLKELEKNLLPS